MATSPVNAVNITELLKKPRIRLPVIKICFEIYHALRPFHHQDATVPSLKSVIYLFFVTLRWYFFLKRLINDKTTLNAPLSKREKIALFIAILGHLLIIWAQRTTLQHERAINDGTITGNRVNENGPYSIIRHPHHLGKWISDSCVSIYQNNKLSMVMSILTLAFTIRATNKEEEEYATQGYQQYKTKVPSKLFPGIY